MSNQDKFNKMHDRVLGGIPAGAARAVRKGDTPTRLADSGDISDLIKFIQAAHDVTRAHIVGATQAQSDVTRAFLADRIKEGAQPSDVADSVIAAIGTDLAAQVVTELSARLTPKKETSK